jgi:tetratricopeptide (TPR) repeat protein
MSASLSHPQPLGIFPYPAGLLLLPDCTDPTADGARAALMRGTVPEVMPAAWQFFLDALQGGTDAALAQLRADPSALAGYNRFVLDGDEAGRQLALRDGEAVLQTMTAMAMFVQGASDALPDATHVDGELRANVLMARAAASIDAGHDADAAALLTDGIAACQASSPVLAAQLTAQLAQLQPNLADASVQRTVALWRSAIALAADTPLPHLRGDLRIGLAITLHEASGDRRDMLVEAVKTYQDALHHGITLEETPETFALAQNNIGLAYLSMPMTDAGDKLRHAVAVQSFREALKVYTPETHLEAWTSTMLNMANALQYLPSARPEEHLIQAVETYEQLLEVRNKAMDPLGYARLLANQANALAHLGMFQPAVEKFTESHKLLHWHGEAELAATILEQLERINTQLATVTTDSDATGGGDA